MKIGIYQNTPKTITVLSQSLVGNYAGSFPCDHIFDNDEKPDQSFAILNLQKLKVNLFKRKR
jgi:hypothetical protein